MKKFLLISCISFLCACAKKQEMYSGPPNIQFYEPEHDFGIINQRISIPHVFKFKNTGGDTLVIDNIRAP